MVPIMTAFNHDLKNVWFTSDTHFNHANIITYSKRPFKDVPEMNAQLIARWNACVAPTDTIIHLGDFAMGPKTEHKGFLDQLNGRKILIRGNHDDNRIEKLLERGFAEVHTNALVEVDGLKVYLSHIPTGDDPYADRTYPPALIQPPPEHDLFLCGHVHEKFRRRNKVVNVGSDVWNYTPVRFSQLLNCPQDAEDPKFGKYPSGKTLEAANGADNAQPV